MTGETPLDSPWPVVVPTFVEFRERKEEMVCA
jgi:hypothetical protein